MNAREKAIEAMARAMRVQANIGPVDPWEVAPEWAKWRWIEQATVALDALAPVPAGEVETPCATCGGIKHEGGTFHPDTESFLKGLDCPDCGVETPEAAVEAGAKIYAYWRQNVDPGDVPYWMTGPLAASIRNARQFLPLVYRAWRADLIAQGWTPPGTKDAK